MIKKLLLLVRSLFCSIHGRNIFLENGRQFFQFLYVVMFAFSFVNYAEAQTASATWALTANGNSANVGNVTGMAIAKGNGLGTFSYNATWGVSTGSWSNDASSLVTDEYYEFKVTPTANSIFNVSSISFQHSTSAGNWDVRAYYSTDNFATTSTPIGAAAFSSTTTSATNSNTVTIPVDNITLTIRIYGWESDGNNSLRIRNFVINGTTCTKPNSAGSISGTSTVCQGQNTVNYTVAAITNATGYSWTLPTGATIVSGANTRSITVNYGTSAVSGNITVQGTNSCGNGTASVVFPVLVNPAPNVISSATPTSVSSGSASTLNATVTPATESVVLLQEGFNGTTNTWSTNNSSTPAGTSANNTAWTLRPDGYYYAFGGGYSPNTFHSNDNSQFYLSNSAVHTGATDTRLRSPAINTMGFTTLSLDFYHFIRDFDTTNFCRVQVSTDNTNWTTIVTYDATSGAQGADNAFLLKTVSLNSYINQPVLYIRFKYEAAFDWFWAIDNVTISGNKTIDYNYSWTATPSATAGLPANAGTALSTNKTISVAPTQTTNYTVIATNVVTGCYASAIPVQVTIASPIISSFTPTSACSGSAVPVTITGTNFNGATAVTFNGVTASYTVISNTQINTTLPSTATTGAISVTTAGGTATSTSFTVNPLSVGGTISGDASLCIAGGSTNLTLAGSVGSIVQWESSIDNFATAGTPIANTTNSLSVSGLTATTYYRAQVKSGSCSSVYSTVWRVATGAVTATAATLPICNGFTANWNKVSGASSYLIDVSTTNTFSSFVINGTDVGDVASYAVTGLSPNTQYYYRISPIYACGVYAVTSGVVSIKTGLSPAIAAISSPAAFCVGGLLNPSAPTVTANGAIISSSGWQIETAAGNNTYTALTLPLTVAYTDNGKNIKYFAISGCGTTYSNSVAITVNDKPTIAAISAPSAFCAGTGSLNPSAPTVTAQGSAVSSQGWQIETAAGNNTYTALTLPLTVAYTDNGKNIRYFAISGCGTTYSNSVAITVNDKPSIAAILAPSAFCAGTGSLNPSAPTVTAKGSAVSSQGWQIETVAGNNTYTGLTLPLTVAYTDNGKNIRYFAISGCGTTYSNSVTITVNDKPTIAAISAPAALCAEASLNATAPTVTAQGSAVSSQGWQIETVAGNNTYTGLTLPLTVAYTDNGKNIRYFAISGCGTTYSNSVTITINDKPTIAAISAPAALCAGASLNATAPIVTAQGSAVSSQGWQIETAAGNNTYAALTLPLTVAYTDNGKNIRYFAISGCGTTYSNSVTVTVNALPAVPDTNTTQPNCDVTTGTITANSLEATSYILTKISDGSNFTNTDGIFSGLAVGPYDVTIQNSSGCISPAVRINITSVVAKQWTGASDTDWNNSANWSPSGVPGTGDCVLIPDTRAINKPIINSNITAYSIIVNDYGLLTVNSDKILTVSKEIIVDAVGSFVFENNSSLLQSDPNAANSGNITYKRITSDVRRYDFTCWSSPIQRTPFFTLHDVSPLTLADKYYSFNPSTGWKISYNGILPMEKGMGYIVRAPQHYDIVTPAPYEASFIGTPNNGTVDIVAEANKNILVGNPYPSALNAWDFINENSARGVDVGSLYFWTHNSPPVNSIPGDRKYYYNTADYAVFNLSGSTESFSGANSNKPSGYIAAAASFFIRPNRDDVRFTNSMREGIKNDQFYKTAKKNDEGKNRLWLNFANTEGAFKQALIGYIDGATDNLDYNYDAPTNSGNAYVDFYSINNTDKLTIQGRALPFNDADFVPLGYVSKIVGDFTISIDEADGLFDTQAVYLEDKTTGKTVDLRAENYTFATEKGTFEDRFVLRYTNKTLGTGDFENIENGLLVSVKDKTVKIISAKEAIKEVTIFDINGKLLYDKKKISSTELQVSNLQVGNQVLLVKVILENGFTTTKKIVFQ
jgi:heat shock protein HslJ